MSKNYGPQRGYFLGGLFAVLVALTWGQALSAAASPDVLKIDRVVLLMRHGVRSPDHNPPTPSGVAAQPWPEWSVKPGWLTAHGVAAIEDVAKDDRRWLTAAGLLPARRCPMAGSVRILSNSLERTILTAETYAALLSPGCQLPVQHRSQDEPDPLFPWLLDHRSDYNPQAANQAVLTALGAGGADAAEASERSLLLRLDRILCGAATSGCGVSQRPSHLVTAVDGRRPYVSGAVGDAVEPAQVLLLEYADGWPMDTVGWGRAKAADVTAMTALIVEAFRLGSRPPYLARLNDGPIQSRMLSALTDDGSNAAKLTVIVGHDGNVASLAAVLDLHWHVPGFAPDYPSLGGAIGFERLTDAAQHHYIRAVFRSQSLEQIRSLRPFGGRNRPYFAILRIPGCRARGVQGLCTLAAFK
jgi:4-phytase/acid phosphatase